MKDYELVIEERQPPCGGKSPIKTKIMNVSTDDPVAYVQALEAGNKLETSTLSDGTLVVQTEHNGFWIKYESTED